MQTQEFESGVIPVSTMVSKTTLFLQIYNQKSRDYLFQLATPRVPIKALAILHSSNFIMIYFKNSGFFSVHYN